MPGLVFGLRLRQKEVALGCAVRHRDSVEGQRHPHHRHRQRPII
jgi:hypothetical protein